MPSAVDRGTEPLLRALTYALDSIVAPRRAAAHLSGVGPWCPAISVTAGPHEVGGINDPQSPRVLSRILGQLRAVQADRVVVAGLLVRLLRAVVLEPILPVAIPTIADLCFETVIGPRAADEVQLADILERLIRLEFRMLPVQCGKLLTQLAQYRAVRQSGIVLA